ncbi:helix-turn-helix transcriptional regulator [Chitinophaga polysaccharea]|uniref:helix-turn-helix domain-containing protein n=1 Tax=Chitinophaga TaxID=79328 RepID=UPI001455B2C5|nr:MULTISPECIES: AraC family transcriptional regulator [Chitinophaga]NLR57734.1 helix-turn-helix transcriptional regulator [Chitinophaga polysaccharea]NLU93328.1 helix-turn-helix transcriptional regulator [Chitinophaga sp. Ak27]
MSKSVSKPIRQSEVITQAYFTFLDKHITDVINGDAPHFMELNQIAAAMFVSHAHLTATIQQTMGHHPCHFYDGKIIDAAKKMLAETDKPIAEIANILTYDPSNFSKFFKKITGQTPGHFREKIK